MVSRRAAIRLAALGAGVLSAAPLALVGERVAVGAGVEGLMAGEWVHLSDLAWQEASTGWLGVANLHLPRKDRAFPGSPIRLAGTELARGIGTYPLSEITYQLGGDFARFRATVGADDAAEPNAGALRFRVYADTVLRHETRPLRTGDQPEMVEVDLLGAKTMRLVALADGELEGRLYADWGSPQLMRPVVGTPLADAVWAGRVRADQSGRAEARAKDQRALADRAAALFAQLEPLFAAAPTGGSGVVLGEGGGWVGLRSLDLIVALGIAGDVTGQVVVLDRDARAVAVDGARPSAAFGDRELRPAAPGRVVAREAVDEPPFGRGQRVRVAFPTRGGELTVELAAFVDGRYFLYGLEAAGGGDAPTFRFLDLGAGRANVGEGAQYLTDFSRLRHAIVRDDGLTRRESVGPGKPTFLWSDDARRGLLLASLDESRGPTQFAIRRDAGRVAAAVEYTTGLRRVGPTDRAVSPRVYVELPRSVDPRFSHASFKRVTEALYPSAVPPDWFKYQWITWYAFNMDIDEAKVRAQIDYIADNLADLGPWNVEVDAGWYVSEGRPGSDWRNVDRAKFPSGYRALVDYAHQRGVRVIGYVSPTYLDSRERPYDWLGLREIVQKHRDWLTELGGDETHESFSFDYANPAVRQYWSSVLSDLFVEYGVDGIKIDGLGNAEGAELSPNQVDEFGRVDAVADQTMDVYRFFHEQLQALKPDAYVMVGWMNALYAKPYAHTFWYCDEYPAFTSDYPFGGLKEHTDYALFQQRLLGQRPHMGSPWDKNDPSPLNQQWLAAGLALGTKVSPSWDLAAMSPEALAAYRHLLVHYDAFAPDVRYGPGLYPDYFATTVNGTTYLGFMNRDAGARTIAASLEEVGLDPAVAYSGYDVQDARFRRVQGEVALPLEGQSFRLLILRRRLGVLWTGSSFDLTEGTSNLTVTVRGPASIPGDLALACPPPTRVTIDGRSAGRRLVRYDAEAGVLQLRYRHDRPHVVEVSFA